MAESIAGLRARAYRHKRAELAEKELERAEMRRLLDLASAGSIDPMALVVLAAIALGTVALALGVYWE